MKDTETPTKQASRNEPKLLKSDRVVFNAWIALGTTTLLALAGLFCLGSLGAITSLKLLLALGLSSVFLLLAQAYRRFVILDKSTQRSREFAKLEQLTGKRYPPSDLAQLYKDEYSVRAYTLFVLPALAMSLIGWCVLLFPPGEEGSGLLAPLVAFSMGLGFLGALVFSFQLLWQRLTTEDLKPSIFSRCAMAMFCGMVYTFVVFSATSSFKFVGSSDADELTGTAAVVGHVVAFSLGYFPMLAISWFTRIAHQALGEPSRRADSQRLVVVDGISTFHEERLLEEGIHNIHDLAFADLGTLLVNSPYTAQQIADWADQCRLYLLLDSSEASSFRRGGIRNASAFEARWSPLYGVEDTTGEQDGIAAKRKNVALSLQATEERLDSILIAIKQGS